MTFNKQLVTASVVLMTAASMPIYADPSLEVTGVVEVELGTNSLDSSSDAVLATIELAFDAIINEKVSAHILMLHEEDDTALVIDEGTITVGDEDKISVTMGQMYLPFGAFESNVVSDPLTLELGEIRESAIMVTANAGDISASFYIFNGNTIETGSDDKVDNSGFSVSYSKDGLDVGLDYISSIGDSDSLQELFDDGTGAATLNSYVAGLSIHAMYSVADFNAIVEHVAAQDAFLVADFGTALTPSTPREPSATNIDFGYSFGDQSVGLAIQ